MDDDSRSIINDLKKEWKLFWNNLIKEGFQREDDEDSTETHALFPADVSLSQLQGITKKLSRQRHEIHQRLEAIQKELNELEDLLAEQKVCGKNPSVTLGQIDKLNDLGQKWSDAIDLLTGQLKIARQREALLLAREKTISLDSRRRAQV